MTTAEQNLEDADAQRWDLSFSAIEVGGSAALGADIRLDLAQRTTVLVGKNGAGKSFLLEKLQAGIFAAIGVPQESDPARFACEVNVRSPTLGEHVEIRYECRFQLRDTPATEVGAAGLQVNQVSGEADIKVEETCRLINAKGTLLWQVDDGLLTYNTGEQAEIAVGRTLLNWSVNHRRRRQFTFPNLAYPLRDLFWGVIRVPAGVPRSAGEREELALPYPESHRDRRVADSSGRIRRLAYNLVGWHDRERARFDEFVELSRRTGLLDEVKVKIYRDPEAGRGSQRRDLVSILVDGTDLGLLSDGTLRVAEILMWLLYPELKLLLIEEPETAVHPGLLARLLAEFDAYSSDPSPHRIRRPKEKLIELSRGANKKPRHSENDNYKLAEELELEECARRCPEFDSFAKFLRGLTPWIS